MTAPTPSDALRDDSGAAEAKGTRRRAPRWLGATLSATIVGLIVMAITLVRVPQHRWDQVWAEDGRNFLGDVIAHGGIQSLFLPYEGYLHVLPRLGSALVSTVAPLEHYAAGVIVVSGIMTGLVAALVFTLSTNLFPNPLVRSVVAISTACIPLASAEVIGNLANLHWYFLWLAPFLILSKRTSRSGQIAVAVVALLIGLSEIQVIVFVPLGLLVLLLWRDKTVIAPTVGLAIAAIAQIATTLLNPRSTLVVDRPSILETLGAYPVNVTGTMLLPDRFLHGAAIAEHGLLVPLLTTVPFVALFIVVLALGTRKAKAVATYFFFASGAIFCAGYFLNASAKFLYLDLPETTLLEEGVPVLRYGVVPGMLLIAIVGLATEALLNTRSKRRRLWLVLPVIALVALIALMPFTTPNRVGSTSWVGAVTTAVEACERDDSGRQVIQSEPSEVWVITPSCEWVLENSDLDG
ncbi:hypothetical protein [Humidisolicoccus flavus]|uniref:hypothetical protein n=1 Tax=Humidisolicoccus flavus TaxID=3111414 RepID=UPI00324FB2ED